MTRTRIVLVRHGQTEWNVTRRFQGQADVPLDDKGRAQAEVAASELRDVGATVCYSSDLSRAMETAETLTRASGLTVVPDARLREVHVGEWEGWLLSEVAEQFPWYTESLRNRVDVRRSETGETGTEAGQRVASALQDYAERHSGQTVLVVGHGFATRVGLALLLGMTYENSFSFASLWNCSWTVLEHSRDWRLVHYNQVAAGHSGELPSVAVL